MIAIRIKKPVMLVSGLIVIFIGWWLWSMCIPAIARDLNPVIQELTALKLQNGIYPTNLLALASIQKLSKRRSLYYGERKDSDLFWDAFQVSAHELTVLSCTNTFTLFAPTGRIKLYSFSSFPVWKCDSESPEWKKGRIHWSMVGTYWSID